MINTVFRVVIFSFIVIIFETNNIHARFDKFIEIQVSASIVEVANMTDQMKFICIQIDANGANNTVEDKEHQAQCKKFLDNVSIYELRELIVKYIDKKTTN